MIRLSTNLGIAVSLLLLSIGCNEDRLIRPVGIAVYEIQPAGGPPGAVVRVRGLQFRSRPRENTITIDGLPAEVLSASDTLLSVRIPEQAAFAVGMLIVESAGLLPDTARIIVSDTPLAEATSMSPVSGSPGTLVTVAGKNFVSDTSMYFVTYEKSDGSITVPMNSDSTLRNTIKTAYPDSLQIEIPEGFQKGRIRIITSTSGRPEKVAYEVLTPVFTVL